MKKISGPLLDRIDIHIAVPRLEYSELTGGPPAEASSTVRARVIAARKRQLDRLGKSAITCNAQMSHRQVKSACVLSDEAQTLMRQAFDRFGLSARGYARILKVARTIADLAGEDIISIRALGEAIHLRNDIKETLGQ